MLGIIYIITLWFSSFWEHTNAIFDPAVAELSARLYCEYMELCTTSDNSYIYRTQIIYDLCEDPQIAITSDLPGNPGESIQINEYLNELSKVSQSKKLTIEYDDNIVVSQCISGNIIIWAAQTKKHIINNGKTKSFDEVLELGIIDGKYRILSIHSNYIREMSVDCKSIKVTEDAECKIIDLAKEEYNEGRVELAVAHLEEAKMCGIDYSDHEVKEISLFNVDSIIKSSFNKGQILMNEGNYNEALTYFYSIQRSNYLHDAKINEELNNKIKFCKLEIDYLSFIQQGDFLYSQYNFKEAAQSYLNASNIKSSNYVENRIAYCMERIKTDYEKQTRSELAMVDNLVRSNQKDQAEAFRIIMKYRYSGALSGKHYFYAAQISESPPAAIKNEYRLIGKNQCLFTRQMLLDAYGMGYESEGFRIFWDEYLTQKTRTCD